MIPTARRRAAAFDTHDATFPPPSAGEGACGAGGRGAARPLRKGWRSPLPTLADARATLPRRGGREDARGLLYVLLLLAAFTTAIPAPAFAQQRGNTPARPQTTKPPEKEPPPPAEPPPAPYDRDLLRLSEIIGSLAFLRGLCATPDAAEWPTRMKALMEAEGGTPTRRDRLAGAYNRGYRGYSLTYRVCTPAATEAAARFVTEGERLSATLAGRFGG